jgi:hypothetical protein
MLCVTRKSTNALVIFHSNRTTAVGQGHYPCRIWKAGFATAAAAFYFESIKVADTGEEWCDGGMNRNNPVFEVLIEARRVHGTERSITCMLSLGCGVGHLGRVSNSICGFASGAFKMMTDAEATRRVFEESQGKTLREQGSYFRFNFTRGRARIHLDDLEPGASYGISGSLFEKWKAGRH